MHCYICDRPLGNDEIKYNPKYARGKFDPCGVCLEVIENVFEPLSESELDSFFSFEEEETIHIE